MTLALCITGNVPIIRSIFVFVAQLIGGIAAAAAVKGLIPGDDVFFAVHLTSGTSITQGLFLEMFFTVELVFTILMLAAEVFCRLSFARCHTAVFLSNLFSSMWIVEKLP